MAEDAENRLRGEPAEELIRATQSPDTDLIMLGPNLSSLILRGFTGSVTQRLPRSAACNVLICRPAEGLRSTRAGNRTGSLAILRPAILTTLSRRHQ
ncbi:universal stress protein [Leisingera methylohalidivorans DSM 14336]|uniref:Universal stress protein n=1 Tax=Leisingera methylohalidivorans DSM 14336 TaxID=999552 RepID=V9VWV7_9RHOB|nr:universal stress protein [Leisingera methylohalidivorans DSM 14336]